MQPIEKYLPIVSELAAKALSMAVDASSTRPAKGQVVESMVKLVPLAQRLLSDSESEMPGDEILLDDWQKCLSNPEARVVDGLGHYRPIYRYLAADVITQATGVRPNLPDTSSDLIHEQAWQIVCEQSDEMIKQGVAAFGLDFDESNQARPMHGQTLDDAPEDWTYRDLVALHAMMTWGLKTQDAACFDVCRRAARFHLEHTQPDYTTYQPWALAAFLLDDKTAYFAEQQLHDVQTHLSLQGGGGAVVPGLVLAHAAKSLRMFLPQSVDNADVNG